MKWHELSSGLNIQAVMGGWKIRSRQTIGLEKTVYYKQAALGPIGGPLFRGLIYLGLIWTLIRLGHWDPC